MALRTPIYLDTETLLAQAEYHDVNVPRQAEIVEKTIRKRSASGSAAIPGIGKAGGALGRDVEYQSTYTLTPSLKATVNKVIDALVEAGIVCVDPGDDIALSKDDLVQLEGVARITAASLAGKMFHIIRRVLDGIDDVSDISSISSEDPEVMEQLKQVYLQNELLPIPVLLELTGTTLPQKVYVTVRPSQFVDAASADRLEREIRVLGSVRNLIDHSKDGYLSAEEWLLDGYEYLIRRKLMPTVVDVVKNLVDDLDLDLPVDDVHAYISGPAIIVDAVSIY